MNTKTVLTAALGASVTLLVPNTSLATVTITSAPGFELTWDGNDGDHFDPAAPPGGAVVPDNLALASNGATAITSSDLGPELSIPFHVAGNLNDGFYGNSNSWISASGDPGPPNTFGGVLLPTMSFITGFALGRDNGNGAFDDSSSGSDACGGQCDDRTFGSYTVQFTSDGGSNWTTLGTLDYVSTEDIAPGGAFTAHLRHQFGVSLAGGAPLVGDGIRLLVPASGLAGGTAIDEIEIYGAPIPEPATAGLVLLSLAAFAARRRRAAR